MSYTFTWEGDEVLLRGSRALGRGLIGIGEAVATEGKRNAHVISGTMRRSVHVAPHGYTGGNDEEQAASGADLGNVGSTTDWGRAGFDHALDVGSWASYACFPAGTAVTMADGSVKKIECVAVGDLVLTHRGRGMPVTATQARPFTGELIAVKRVGDSRPIVATPEHPVLSLSDGKQSWRPFGDLPQKKQPRSSTALLAPTVLATIEPDEIRLDTVYRYRGRSPLPIERWKEHSIPCEPDLMRLLGYYLAEGYDYGRFSFHEDEVDYHADVIALLKEYFGVTVTWMPRNRQNRSVCFYVKNPSGASLSERRIAVAQRFFEVLAGKGTAHKRVPGWMLRLPLACQRELLTGFWRGDAGTTVSWTLAEQLRLMLLRAGAAPGVSLQPACDHVLPNGRTIVRRPIFHIYEMAGTEDAFAEATGKTAQQNARRRPVRRFGDFAAYRLAYGREKLRESWPQTEVHGLPVYNFSVAEDESYVVNGIAVHNCVEEVGRGHAFMQPAVEAVSGPRSEALMARAFAEEGLVLA